MTVCGCSRIPSSWQASRSVSLWAAGSSLANEKVGAASVDVHFVATLENPFVYLVERGQGIVLLHEADFRWESISEYEKDTFVVRDAKSALNGCGASLQKPGCDQVPLDPDGLLPTLCKERAV